MIIIIIIINVGHIFISHNKLVLKNSVHHELDISWFLKNSVHHELDISWVFKNSVHHELDISWLQELGSFVYHELAISWVT
jgi:hypothetical protein